MGLDDDAGCDDLDGVAHEWGLTELRLSLRGADQVKRCLNCDAVQYEPGQAAVRDTRPPL